MTDPLDYLFGLERLGIKFGLENMRAIVAALGHPERAYDTVHVAGTNGKGSVTALVETALRLAGHRSARFTSPHLVRLNERFVIDGREVPTADLAAAAGRLRETVARLLESGTLVSPPTFFEATTAIAFDLFRAAGVRAAVIEVGLGGRLDSTNVVEPLLTAITSIDFDHEHFLGHTLAAIAAEKAGIVKPGVPVVVGRVHREAAETIRAIAAEREAPLIDAWTGTAAELVDPETGAYRLRTAVRDYGTIVPALLGEHQIANAVVAVRLLEAAGGRGLTIPPDAVVGALEHAVWPGRLDRHRLPGGREALLDAAHNPAGAETLASYLLRSSNERRPLVFGAMGDKDARGILQAMLPAVGPVIVTRASTPRAADPESLAATVRALAPDRDVVVAPSPDAALAAAFERAPRIVVAGSIFLLGDVLQAIERGA